MVKVKEVIVVEGRYDKNTLLQVVDAVIVETAGFGIFNDAEKLALIRRLAERQGIVVLTDSDGAGFVIRNYLKGAIDPAKVKHAYIPDVEGREKRKRSYSKERKLGVEGMRPEVLIDALRRSGATLDNTPGSIPELRISKADLYAAGLSGRQDSAAKRQALLRHLELPACLSPNALLDVLNALMTREAFLQVISSETVPLYRPR
ncbi:MAG: toprim domain-containing protein [Oscillospiraceae bacterium]|jgi:ribonuclease M5